MGFNINNIEELKELLEALKSDLNLNMNIEININESDEEIEIIRNQKIKKYFDFEKNRLTW